MSRAVAISIGAGLVGAVFTLSVLMGSLGAMILAYLAPLSLFAVGLSLGAPASLIATGSGALAVALAAGIMPALAFIATTGLPSALIVRQALLSRSGADGSIEWYPPGMLLLWMAGYVLLLVVVVGAAGGVLFGDIYQDLNTMLDELAEAERGTAMGPYFEMLASPPVRDAFIKLLPGAMAASWILLMIINAALAQGALSAIGRAQRPNPRMADIDLPVWASLGLIGALAIGSYFGGIIGLLGTTVTVVGLALFTLYGLGIIHAIMLDRAARIPVLVGIYVFLTILFWPIFFVAGLAVLEPWMGLKRRLAVQSPTQNS